MLGFAFRMMLLIPGMLTASSAIAAHGEFLNPWGLDLPIEQYEIVDWPPGEPVLLDFDPARNRFGARGPGDRDSDREKSTVCQRDAVLSDPLNGRELVDRAFSAPPGPPVLNLTAETQTRMQMIQRQRPAANFRLPIITVT
jgi:hypothetical protein